VNHPDHAELLELLDGYVDDELTADERTAIDELLASSADARATLADIERVRSLVQGLPPVEPPFGFYERLTRRDHPPRRSARGGRRNRLGLAIASVGAVAAAIVLVVAIAPVGDRLAPPVDELGERHAVLTSATHELPDGYTEIDDADAEVQAPYEAPAEMPDDYRRVTVYRAPEGVHVLYGNGTAVVSVFEQRGRVDWSGLPERGTRVELNGDDALMVEPSSPAAGPETIVVARDDLVLTIVGRVPHQAMVELAEAIPDPPAPAISDRVGGACRWLAEGFGFPG
jgi:hypothetical protein